jgi:23S rRNA maturation mini-RNase III
VSFHTARMIEDLQEQLADKEKRIAKLERVAVALATNKDHTTEHIEARASINALIVKKYAKPAQLDEREQKR